MTPIVYAQGYTRVTALQELGNKALAVRSSPEAQIPRMLRSSQALFASLPKHGRKRRYLAQTREELCTDSPHLAANAYEVRQGWWVDTHTSRAGIETRIRMACEVAGVKYGKDLVVNLG